MIQIAMTLALSVAIAVLSLQSCSQTGARMEAAAGLAAYTEALRQYRQAHCTELPQTLGEQDLRDDAWLSAPLPPGTTWSAVFTSRGAMDVSVTGSNTPAVNRVLVIVASRTGGRYQTGRAQFTVTPTTNSYLTGAGFMRKQNAYPWRECRYL